VLGEFGDLVCPVAAVAERAVNEYHRHALALFDVMESDAMPYIRLSDDRRSRGALSKGAGSKQRERQCQKETDDFSDSRRETATAARTDNQARVSIWIGRNSKFTHNSVTRSTTAAGPGKMAVAPEKLQPRVISFGITRHRRPAARAAANPRSESSIARQFSTFIPSRSTAIRKVRDSASICRDPPAPAQTRNTWSKRDRHA